MHNRKKRLDCTVRYSTRENLLRNAVGKKKSIPVRQLIMCWVQNMIAFCSLWQAENWTLYWNDDFERLSKECCWCRQSTRHPTRHPLKGVRRRWLLSLSASYTRTVQSQIDAVGHWSLSANPTGTATPSNHQLSVARSASRSYTSPSQACTECADKPTFLSTALYARTNITKNIETQHQWIIAKQLQHKWTSAKQNCGLPL